MAREQNKHRLIIKISSSWSKAMESFSTEFRSSQSMCSKQTVLEETLPASNSRYGALHQLREYLPARGVWQPITTSVFPYLQQNLKRPSSFCSYIQTLQERFAGEFGLIRSDRSLFDRGSRKLVVHPWKDLNEKDNLNLESQSLKRPLMIVDSRVA